MKKFMLILIVVALVMVFATSAMAHPPHREGEAGKANENAMDGLHNAHHNVMHNSNGRADHVLHDWVIDCPHD